jgi:predicted ATPase/class 3 adenylate cyclase
MDTATPLPTGTVTFLFTDIEGSTRLWEQHPEAMTAAVARHDTLLRTAITTHGGSVFKTMGDAFFAAFPTPTQALAAALQAQQALHAEAWGDTGPLRVRMALHTGVAELRGRDYFGAPLNRIARLLTAGHGGQVLLSQATFDLVQTALPSGSSVRDLGAHRLKDLQQPERIFQVLHPELPADFPPLRSLEAFAHNLPRQLTSFIGREREIAEVKRFLAKTALLTLTGAGGSGKTRLALQVAAEVLDEYPDGVWLVELAPLADPDLASQTVASVLGVREEPGRPLTATLADYLRGKQALLVLDNCEHLLSACAGLGESLLRACPKLQILATSREGLGVGGEQTYRVPTLSLPDPGQLPPLERLQEFEAVQLFADRARLTQPTFAVTQANAPAVVQVCDRLDGIPLAIELAAARVKALAVEQIVERLDDRFRLLTGGSRTALPRQQTLRALIDWSYELLTEAERALLRRLSVFAGGWTLAAAEAVGGGDGIEEWEVLDLLTQLVEKSLVLYEDEEGEARYRLLETIRQYSAERLQASEVVSVVRGWHRDWFVALAERAGPALFGGEQAVWVRRLAREHDNLRAAIAWSFDTGAAEAGLRLGASLWRFWHIRGYPQEGRERLAAALSGATARTRLRAHALDGAGVLALRAAWDLVAAHAHYEEMLAIGHELRDRQVIAIALNGLGHVALLAKDPGRARPLFEQGLALAREVGHTWEVAFALHCLGYLFVVQGDDAAAWRLLKESLAIRREHGDLWSIYWTLSVMAIVAEEGDDPAVARALREECVAICRELGTSPDLLLLRGLAKVAWIQGDFGAARTHYEEMRTIAQERGWQTDLASSVYGLGSVAISQGEVGIARSCFEESLVLGREVGEQWLVAGSLEGLGDAARYQGDDAAACSFYEECLLIWREPEGRGAAPGDHSPIWPHTAAGSLLGLGRVAQKQGDGERAAALYREGLARCQKVGRKLEVARAVEALGSLAVAQGQPERAARLFGAAEAFRDAAGAPIPPVDRAGYERDVAAVYAVLGAEAFAAAWAEARAMSPEQVLADALEHSTERSRRARAT